MIKIKNKTVHFVSLGCSKNLVDSQVMLGHLNLSGYSVVADPSQAEVIVVNTCGFISDAKQESVDTILEMADYKDPDNGKCQILVMAGCMAQRYPQELKGEMPEVDLFIGTGEYNKIAEFLKEFESDIGQKSYVDDPRFIHTELDPRLNTSPSYMAWLKVAEGCDRCCTFCAIPAIRGKFRSRTVDSLVHETVNLVESGAREFNLIAQDFSKYGCDLGGENTIPNLLSSLEQIDGVDWLRIFYFYPDDLDDEAIELIRNSKKICKYLDIPVQHFSDRILKRMNRRITGGEILEKIQKLRERIPGIALRTSILVGFPGETDEDFEILLDGIKKAGFDHLGVFKYSDEEGTAASRLGEKVPQEIIDERYEIIYETQEEIASEINERYLGQTLEVIIEGYHDDTDLLLQGRHRGQAPDIDGKVIINDGTAQIGDIVNVEITEVLGHDLLGGIV